MQPLYLSEALCKLENLNQQIKIPIKYQLNTK